MNCGTECVAMIYVHWMYCKIFAFSWDESFPLKIYPRKKVKLSLREVMDDINRFMEYKELNNSQIEADALRKKCPYSELFCSVFFPRIRIRTLFTHWWYGELDNESGKTQLWYSWKVAAKEFILVKLQLPSLYLCYKLISFAGLLQGFWQKSVTQLIV